MWLDEASLCHLGGFVQSEAGQLLSWLQRELDSWIPVCWAVYQIWAAAATIAACTVGLLGWVMMVICMRGSKLADVLDQLGAARWPRQPEGLHLIVELSVSAAAAAEPRIELARQLSSMPGFWRVGAGVKFGVQALDGTIFSVEDVVVPLLLWVDCLCIAVQGSRLVMALVFALLLLDGSVLLCPSSCTVLAKPCCILML